LTTAKQALLKALISAFKALEHYLSTVIKLLVLRLEV